VQGISAAMCVPFGNKSETQGDTTCQRYTRRLFHGIRSNSLMILARVRVRMCVESRSGGRLSKVSHQTREPIVWLWRAKRLRPRPGFCQGSGREFESLRLLQIFLRKSERQRWPFGAAFAYLPPSGAPGKREVSMCGSQFSAADQGWAGNGSAMWPENI
jgi:hypothetical protein